MLLPAQRGAARVAIHRLGVSCDISKPSASSTDGYGKPTGETWAVVATEPVARFYQSGSEPAAARLTGGRYDTDSPILAFLPDSAIRAGYRVDYDGVTYEVDSFTRYPTHLEARTTVVS